MKYSTSCMSQEFVFNQKIRRSLIYFNSIKTIIQI
jgi:hypothetical protein